ncbi:MAG: hypothetical protein H6702_14665 [Myxococcales bacterium]|nr:hypothetical protein [Myxococcales bacterium]
MARLEDFVSLIQFTPGRAQYALTQAMTHIAAQGDTALARAVGAAQGAAGRLAELEARWATRKAQSTARGNAVAIDNQLDRAVTALHQHLTARLTLLGPEHPQGAKAAELMLRWLPEGPGAVTSLAFEDELVRVDQIIAAVQGPDAAAAAELELGFFVGELARLSPLLRAELAKTAPEAITFDQVRQGRAALQRALTVVVVQAMAQWSASAQAPEFARFMAPLVQQMDRLRALRRRRQPVPDVDPSTGTEGPAVDEDA